MSYFSRPARSRKSPADAASLRHGREVYTAPPVEPTAPYEAPTPDRNGTIFALVMVLFTALTLNGDTPSGIGRYAAITIGLGLAGSVLLDFRRGVWNLPRADLFALLAFYFLTLFEFLFPQPDFNTMTTPAIAREGVQVVLFGFAGLLAGRHLLHPKKQPMQQVMTREIPPAWMMTIFWASCFVGYLHMLLAVDFNLLEMLEWFMAPRFSQPWGRGKFGDWKALLYELGMLIQLLPPLAGIMIARRQRFPMIHLVLMSVVLAGTFFFGFASGTRNVFASYLVTFLIGYAFAVPPARRRELIVLFATCGLLMTFATFFMLEFRTVGLSNYLRGERATSHIGEVRTLYVDYNLYSICRLVEVFPKHKDYLGVEIPYLALIRPIPRAIWKNKPEGMSTSIEEALEVEGLTISASFAGEAYMSGGNIAVFLIGLAFGMASGWWGHLASTRNSEFGILIYASGFFAAVISMRSLFMFTTALLPTVAAIVLASVLVRKLVATTQRWAASRTPTRTPVRNPRHLGRR